MLNVILDHFLLYFYRLYFCYGLYFCDFMFKYATGITLGSFVLLTYQEFNSAVCIIMVPTPQIRPCFLCCTLGLRLFWSEIVLQCVFISGTCILQFLWKMFIFFHLAGSLISLLWKTVSESQLGKRCTSLNSKFNSLP